MPDLPVPHPNEAPASPAEAAAEELLERLRVATRGEYDIFGELGRGGMATVYLAHEISLDRKVAIKVMAPGMLHGPGLVERFKREARTAASLAHPNIIPIYAVREVDGLLFCVIKLVQGTPLDAIIRELGNLPIPMVQAILAQVSDALGYAHRHGVVHRDIKPGNILIDDEGWAVVTDFGIAKVQETEGLTMTGVAVGTPTYMSPEQCSGDVVTGASDQYSLGIVAYEMLCGRAPFTGTSMMALMYSHFHDVPPPLEVFRPDCPAEMRTAVMRMLSKSPTERWLSMEEASMALGARPLPRNDPTRDQLISLARTGVTHRIVSQVQTPRSPIPLGRKRTDSASVVAVARPRYRPALFAIAAVGLLGAGYFSARLASPDSATPPQLGAAVGAQTAEPPPAPAPVPTDPGPKLSGTEPPSATPSSAVPERSADTPLRTERLSQPEPPRTATVQEQVPPPSTTSLPDAKADSPVVRAESSATPPIVSSAPIRVPAAELKPPVPTQTAPQTTVQPAVDHQADVRSLIRAFGNALATGDLAVAQRLYPGMPADQREGLQLVWRNGGSMTPRWTVSDITVDGDIATARIQGTNELIERRGQPVRREPVSLRARLERRGSDWRLVSLVN